MNRILLAIDYLDTKLSTIGLLRPANWTAVERKSLDKLYAGRLFREEPQFREFVGLSFGLSSTNNIRHNMLDPIPLKADSISVFQSQDVFEHIPKDRLPVVIDEIYRILKPGGLFRLSVPDYRFDGYRDRCIFDSSGSIVFDPGGGGDYVNGEIVNGGHVWFPTIDAVRSIIEQTRFFENGTVTYLQYTNPDGSSVLKPVDHSLCYVKRCPDNDPRSQFPRRAQSIIVDLIKA